MTLAPTVAPARLSDHLPALRATLNQQRSFRLQQLAELEGEIDRAPVSTDAADKARHEVTIKLAAAARQALADIDEARTLITTGRYGRCRGCHTEIPIHLLQTIPTTQWCLSCRRHLPAFDGSRPTRGRLPRTASRKPRRAWSEQRNALGCR
ncbi:TraR/DksA C4-type zinc finger protein [Nocardia sp. 2YAB30]|uniref:TraR/DksA C4-type zinc finger protein n=1 Tax=Nocardia sp. 2YAB30 TaxID=3233022 RepID=UPI003F9533D4